MKRPLALLAALSLFVLGRRRSPPAISKPKDKPIEQLRRAVAAKKTDWLDLAAKQAQQHRQAGLLSSTEAAAVQSIVDEAQHGRWDEANRQILWLVRGQQ